MSLEELRSSRLGGDQTKRSGYWPKQSTKSPMILGLFTKPKNSNIYRGAKRVLDISAWDILRATTRLLKMLGITPAAPLRLTAEQLSELKVMRQDNYRAGTPFTASKHWQQVIAFFEDVWRREGITNPEEQSINLRFSGFAGDDLRLHRYVCWMYRRLLEPRDSLDLLHNLPPTCRLERGFAYEMDGDLLSLDLLLSIDDFYNLYELNPAVATEPVVVAEPRRRLGTTRLCAAQGKPEGRLCDLRSPGGFTDQSNLFAEVVL